VSGAWTCPQCGRSFGRAGQSHSCVPAGTLAQSFAGRPEWYRAAFELIEGHLRGLGDVVVEPVQVGVFFKRARSFAELRPMKSVLRVEFLLSRSLDDPRITKTLPLSANRSAYFVDLRAPEEVDATLLAWLAEAYDSSPT
jgi:uncharacterized protein DUF5655